MSHDPLVTSADCDESGRCLPDIGSRAFRLACQARFAGQRVDIEVRARKSKRSTRANAALHAGLSEWGSARGVSGAALREWVEDMKDDLLGLVFGYLVRQNQITGEVTKKLAKPHTSKLTVEEFTELFDIAVVEAAKVGHLWVLPEEFTSKAKRKEAA